MKVHIYHELSGIVDICDLDDIVGSFHTIVEAALTDPVVTSVTIRQPNGLNFTYRRAVEG